MSQQGLHWRPVVAICYDFDKTLSPYNMQEQGFIQDVGFEPVAFWREANAMAEAQGMDPISAGLYMMLKAANTQAPLTKAALQAHGKHIEFFPGVDTWFDRMNAYGESLGFQVEHYIISSGLKEMIEGTAMAPAFKEIYGSAFYYDESGAAVWPAQVVNFTCKTQFLFRIKKGVLGVNDEGVNDFYQEEQMRVPWRRMVYIGDSETDIPCMKLLHSNGGHAIAVYDAERYDKTRAFEMLMNNRINYVAPTDYRAGSELETLLKRILDAMAATEWLKQASLCAKMVEEELV